MGKQSGAAVVSEIRALLLAFSPEERVAIMYNVAVCEHCGDDLMGDDGEPIWCHCENDE